MRLTGKIFLHLLLIGAVTLIPPLVYDAIARYGSGNSPWLFVGGLSYPLYVGWWVTRIRHARLRAILLHLLIFLTLMAVAMFGIDQPGGVWMLGMPAIALLPCLLLALIRAVQKRWYEMRTHLYAFLLQLPFALAFAALFVMAVGMSAMRGMRW